MGPVSSGFSEVRSLFEKEVDELSQNFQTTKDSARLKEVGSDAGEVNVNRRLGLPFPEPVGTQPFFPCFLPPTGLPFRLPI